ncbi:hypothetical protein [Streptomyces radicis]|uniref:hypothetical protein n=1 Tax=Streptomyces radicis TaxID=1750517 RepID=UPI001E63C96D|nr:hypothetical protein [Streptomyces radicis]
MVDALHARTGVRLTAEGPCPGGQVGAAYARRLVPSNHWRALEVVEGAEHRTLPEARHLREACEDMRAAARSPR